MITSLADFAGTVGTLIVPPRCWACGSIAPRSEPLCGQCAGMLPWLEPRAPVARRSSLRAAWSPLSYEGVARELVHALKFAGAPGVAPAMARHLCDALPPRAFPRRATLVPVPADSWRRRRRGFDHAAVLANALADLTGLPVGQPLARRPAERGGQRGLGRSARLAGRGIAVEPLRAAPLECVLVDDVRTTGATAEACAADLRRNGASCVVSVSYCRVL